MATIKSYIDIEQSKKLAEFLPLESADMIYTMVNGYHTPFIRIETIKEMYEDDVLCWSLAALLGVLPDHFYDKTGRMTLGMNKGNTYYNISYENKNSYIQEGADNPIDACVNMIIRLNELNLL